MGAHGDHHRGDARHGGAAAHGLQHVLRAQLGQVAAEQPPGLHLVADEAGHVVQILRAAQDHAHVAHDGVHRLVVLLRQLQRQGGDLVVHVEFQHHAVGGGHDGVAVLAQVGLQRGKVRLAGDGPGQIALLVQYGQPHAHALFHGNHVLHAHAQRRQPVPDLRAEAVVVHHADEPRGHAQQRQVFRHVAAHAPGDHLHVAHVALQRHVFFPGKALHVHEHRADDQHVFFLLSNCVQLFFGRAAQRRPYNNSYSLLPIPYSLLPIPYFPSTSSYSLHSGWSIGASSSMSAKRAVGSRK